MTETAKISSPKEIQQALSVFHDGSIVAHSLAENVLLLTIEIEYLASTLNPGFSTFEVELTGVRDIEFETWPRDPHSPAKILSDVEEVFGAQLEILDAEFTDGKLKLNCNAERTDLDYSGGRLAMRCDAVTVTDEAGTSYPSDELERLSEAYWENW